MELLEGSMSLGIGGNWVVNHYYMGYIFSECQEAICCN